MIYIKNAKQNQAESIAELGKTTYVESHGHFIEDKNDLKEYINEAFSVDKIKEDLHDANIQYYLVYSDDILVGYAKLVMNKLCDKVASQNVCCLEKIYILGDYIPLKIGQQLMTFVEENARILNFDTIWLTVYILNHRAIRFYERNVFKDVGVLNFLVNGTVYPNTVFAKKL